MKFGGSGRIVNASTIYVGPGCTEEDWKDFLPNQYIAVIARNNLKECSINEKVLQSIDKKALASIIFDDEEDLLWSGITSLAPIPVFSVPNSLGVALSNNTANIFLFSNNTVLNLASKNIIAETKNGDKKNTICSGLITILFHIFIYLVH